MRRKGILAGLLAAGLIAGFGLLFLSMGGREPDRLRRSTPRGSAGSEPEAAAPAAGPQADPVVPPRGGPASPGPIESPGSSTGLVAFAFAGSPDPGPTSDDVGARAALVVPGAFGCGRKGRAMKPLEGEEIQIAVRQGALSASRRMTTGPGGKLVLEGLGPGTYGLTFRHRDYLPLEAMVAIPRDLGRGLVLVFEEGLRAQGEVRDPEDRPLPGAVLIWTPSGHPDRPLEAVADAKGSYRIGGLEPGSYLVRAFHADLRAAREGPDRKVTVSEGTANRFDFVEDLGATLAVRVLDKEGLPVPGLLVRFALRTERRGLSGFLRPTDREGKSTLRGLPGAGSLVLEAQGPRGGSGGRPGRVEIDLGALPPEVRLAVE